MWKAYLDLGGEVLHDRADQFSLVRGEAGGFVARSRRSVVVLHGEPSVGVGRSC